MNSLSFPLMIHNTVGF